MGSKAYTAAFAHLPSRHFHAGRTLLYQGEVPRYAFVVKKGTVRAFDIGRAGDERTVAFYTEGDIVPLGWVTEQAPVSLYNYEAYSDAELWTSGRSELMHLINDNPELQAATLRKAFAAYLGATMHIQALEQSRAQDKLLKIMQYLSLKHGKRLGDGGIQIGIRLTQQDLAQLVGITRETAAMELGKLKKKGIITYKSFTYTLYLDKLQSNRLVDEWAQVVF